MVIWAGTAGSLEERVAGGELIPFRAIATGKLRRAGNPLLMLTPANARDMARVPVGVVQARARCGSSGRTRSWQPAGAGLDDDAYDIAAQASAAWEAAVCWDPSGTDQFAVQRLAEVRAV